ncbi:MAG: FG-GAP-like repeat-containing protein, partial [Bacteroidota bacterium]
ASWGDYDNDGYDDLFVPTNDLNAPNILYHNNGNGTFTSVNAGPVTSDLGASIAGTWGDYDNDGKLDLFVANNINSANKLYHNEGNGVFTTVENSPIVDKGVYSHAAAWADYNGDGNLDIVVSDFHPTNFNFIFLGDGQGGFTEDASSVIALSATSAVGVAWGDYDNDGDPDLFIANTNSENNQLFRNDNGVFTAITTGPVVTDGGSSVGGVWGDYDNDGDLDLYVTNSSITEANFFYENNGDGSFTKMTNSVVVNVVSNSHGASWSDYDNDGDLDLIVANDQNKNNFLFSNNGDKTFTQLTNAITEEQNDSYGTAWSDFDNDGDEDLFIANRGANANDFFINEKGSCTNHIAVALQGCNSNSFGIGARIRVKANIGGVDIWQTKHVSTQTSAMGGQNSSRLLFGLLDATSVDSLVVYWPSGVVTELANPAINQILTIAEQCGAKVCGTVFHDANGNQVQDPGENAVPNQMILVTPGNFQAYTGADGSYEFYVDDGSYTLTLVPDSNWTQSFPVSNGTYSLNIVLANQSTYCGNDFGLDALCTLPDLELQLGTTAFRRGLPNQFTVSIANGGAYNAPGPITLSLTTTDNVYMVDSLWTNETSGAGTRTYTYSLPGLAALSDTVLELMDSVALSANIDDLVSVTGDLSVPGGECSIGNNLFTLNDQVVGSIDPNDKLVYVEGLGEKRVIAPGERLLYKIRFQNIGNYAARIVHLVDTLSSDLDWDSFEVVSTSHPMAVSLVDGILQWRNNNIELPDSASDPMGSQGYVMFAIRPKAELPPFTLIENRAFIQFDYNGYIETNTTQILVGGREEAPLLPEVVVYPNPASEFTNVVLLDLDQRPMEMRSLRVLDLQGRTLRTQRVDADRYRLDVSGLGSGTYLLEIETLFGLVYHQKITVSNK